MTEDASPHIDKNENVLHEDGSYRRRDGRVTFWKPTNRFGKGSEFPKLVAPNGYDTVPGFAKRHGLAKNLPYTYIREPVYPIPHLYDEPTGRTYIHRKKGDEWLARVQSDPGCGRWRRTSRQWNDWRCSWKWPATKSPTIFA
jgi:hypothetical protein